MKLLYVHQHFSTPLGSAGTRSYENARRMVADGHKVLMVCGSYGAGNTGLYGKFMRGQRRGIVDGIEVIEFDLAYKNRDGFARRIVIFARFAIQSTIVAIVEKYDVIVATSTPLTAALPGLAARWLRRKPFVFEVRDLWPELPRAMGIVKNRVVLAALSAFERCAYRSAHRLIGLAPGIVDGIASHNVSRNRIALVPNGCDLEMFAPDDITETPSGINNRALRAIFCGTHGLANGLNAVLDAAGELMHRNRHDIEFVLVGDGACKAQLQARAVAEMLTNVTFLNPIGKRELVSLLSTADVGLQILADIPAFYYGTSPNKFFDYLAAGLPTLNNYPGWVASMINENHCGWTVAPGNASAFADALSDAADNRDETRAMGHRALELARRSFDRDKLATEWVRWVEGVQNC